MTTSIAKIPTRPARYLTSEVAFAAGLPLPIVKAWITPKRKLLALSAAERPVTRQGVMHFFSYGRMMQISLMESLGRLGLLPSFAAPAACVFSDTGDSSDEIPGCFGDDSPGRGPSELYAEGSTVLAVRFGNDDSCAPIAAVHLIRDDELFVDVWRRIAGSADGISLVSCNAVVQRVKGRLDIE
jgi:hypothetical protein